MSDKFYDICCQFFSKIEEVDAAEFYRDLFPQGELQSQGIFYDHKYNAIAVELGKTVKRFTLCDDLEHLDELLKTENFVMMAPISYVGKRRTAQNSRHLYALVFDLDGVKGKQGLVNLIYQMDYDILPTPTYIVCSGTGLHLYFLLEEPVPLFPSVTVPLEKLKNALTRNFWNYHVTKLCEENQVQYEPIWQAFRIVGGVTKDFKQTGHRVKAWRYGQPVALQFLNKYVAEEYQMPKNAIQYKSKMSLEEAKEKYPNWYNSRILNQENKKYWTVKRDLYEWWKKKLLSQIIVGHRYYGIMCLAIYAKKCGITFEELKKDAYEIGEKFCKLDNDKNNKFTKQDVKDGLKAYKDEFCTMPINSIIHFSGIQIIKNKRNGRPQNIHLAGARAIQKINDEYNNTNWRDNNGRKSVEQIVYEYLEKNPKSTYKQFVEDTGLQKSVFYKYKKTFNQSE